MIGIKMRRNTSEMRTSMASTVKAAAAGAFWRTIGARRRMTVLACVATVVLAGCADGRSIFPTETVPESADVETAAWPMLRDAPEPVSATGVNSAAAEAAKGDDIRADLASEIARMEAQAAEMAARPVLRRDLSREAAETARQGAALANQ